MAFIPPRLLSDPARIWTAAEEAALDAEADAEEAQVERGGAFSEAEDIYALLDDATCQTGFSPAAMRAIRARLQSIASDLRVMLAAE